MSLNSFWRGALLFLVLGGAIAPRLAVAEDVSTATIDTFPSADKVWLSELDEQNVSVSYDSFLKGTAKVHGVPSPHSLYMNPPATVEYQLGKKYRTFRATAAMNDSSDCPRLIQFQVFGDGKLLWQSMGMNKQHDHQECLVDITGVDALNLKVIYDEKSKGVGASAYAMWLEPFVDPLAAPPELVTLMSANLADSAARYLKFVGEARQFYNEGKFAELNALAEDTRDKPTFLFGKPLLEIFYESIRPNPENEQAWLKYIEKLDKWREADTNSVTPVIALARAWIMYGWNARGEGGYNSVGDNARKIFLERVEKGRSLLEEGHKISIDDPEMFMVAMIAIKALHLERDEFDAVLAEGMKADPRYYPIYDQAQDYLLPRWYGSPGDVEKLAREVRGKVGGERGDEIHARIGLFYHGREPVDFFNWTHFKYSEIKKGLPVIFRDYPDCNGLRYQALRLAVQAEDDKLARLLFATIGPTVLVPPIWKNIEDMRADRRWAAKDHPRGQELKTLHSPYHKVRCLEYMAGNPDVLISGTENQICYWSLTRDSLMHRTLIKDAVRSLAAQPNGKMYAVGGGPGGRGDLALYNFNDDDEPRHLNGHTDLVNQCVFSPDGKTLASASADKSVRLWPLADLDKPIILKHPSRVESCSFSPDGKRLATVTEIGGQVRVWDLEQEVPQAQIVLDNMPKRCVIRFASDGEALVHVGRRSIRLIDLKTKQIKVERRETGVLLTSAISADGKLLAVAGEDIDIELYELPAIRLLHTFKGHSAAIRGLVFSPDGATIASCAADAKIKLWDLAPVKEALNKPEPATKSDKSPN